MHRFAQSFIKPLMSQDAVLREIKAVDSGRQLFCADICQGLCFYDLQSEILKATSFDA